MKGKPVWPVHQAWKWAGLWSQVMLVYSGLKGLFMLDEVPRGGELEGGFLLGEKKGGVKREGEREGG